MPTLTALIFIYSVINVIADTDITVKICIADIYIGIQNYSYDFCFIDILNLASDPDRLIGPEGYAEQGTEEGISTNEDECYRKKEKNITVWSCTISAVLSHIVGKIKCKSHRWTKHVARTLTNPR